jgi:hypothetical protein
MAKKWSRNTPLPRRFNDIRSRHMSKTTVTMGKKFRTRAGRYGCYVYINGTRSHFEETTRKSRASSRHAYQTRYQKRR